MSRDEMLRAQIESGLREHNRGNIASAIESYQGALAIAPDDPNATQLMGVALLQLERPEEALGYLERAARRLRSNPAVIGNLAQAYFTLGRYQEARAAFSKAARLTPREIQYQLGVATSLAMAGALVDAETLLRRISARFPQDARARFNLGNTLRDQGKVDEAIEQYRQAIRLDPQMVEARNNLAGQLQTQQRFLEAEREFRECIQVAPDYLLAQCNLASVLIDMGRFGEAEQVCRSLIDREPGFSQAHTFLGAAIGHQGRLWEAVKCHRDATRIASHDAKVIENFAGSLIDVGELNEGLVWFLRALELSPHSLSAHQTLGTALLSHGLLNEGWAKYTFRAARLRFQEKYSHLALPDVLPDDLSGKRICILREQGLGDEIFFLRYAPQLRAAGARLSYCASAQLLGILGRTDYFENILAALPEASAADTFVLAGDLPHALSRYPSTRLPTPQSTASATVYPELVRWVKVYWPEIPPPLPLPALAQNVDAIRHRLAKAGKPPYLGLTWQGGIAPHEQQGAVWSLYKYISIGQLAGAVRYFPGTLVALQRNPGAGDIEAFSSAIEHPVHDFTDLNEDLESMLALLAVIDEYVGVSNTNMHLRAGVGKTARVLVPCPADWRWLARGRESPWFPGFTVYRQGIQGDWSAALVELASDLAASFGSR